MISFRSAPILAARRVRACVLLSQFWFLSHSWTHIRLIRNQVLFREFAPAAAPKTLLFGTARVRACVLSSQFWFLRHPGRLGGDSKDQVLFKEFAPAAAPKPLLLGSARVRACVLSSQFWFLGHSWTHIKLIRFAKVWNYGQFGPPQGPLHVGSERVRAWGFEYRCLKIEASGPPLGQLKKSSFI